jgi:hypothetical protein
VKALTEKQRLAIYDDLREMHRRLEKIFQRHIQLSTTDDNALEAVDSVLYLAEGVFAKND